VRLKARTAEALENQGSTVRQSSGPNRSILNVNGPDGVHLFFKTCRRPHGLRGTTESTVPPRTRDVASVNALVGSHGPSQCPCVGKRSAQFTGDGAEYDTTHLRRGAHTARTARERVVLTGV